MEAMLKEYREKITAQIEECTDASLLDLIHQLLTKSKAKESLSNGTEEKL